MHGINSSFGVFFNPLQTEFGWNRATIAGASSVAFFLTGLFSTVAGRLTDKYGPRFTLGISAVTLSLSYLLMAQIHEVWQLYLFYGVFVAIGQSGGDMGLLPTVARWFLLRRSLMSSIVKVGTGTGMFLIPLVSAFLITHFGWRTAYTALAGLAFLVILLFSRLLIKEPGDMALRPYGEAEAKVSVQRHGANLVLKEVLRTPQFWIVSGVYFCIWFSTQSVMIHIAPRGIDSGMTVSQAASIVSVIGAGSILGRIGMGAAGDRIGTKRALIVCLCVLITALIVLQFVREPWMFFALAPVYGFAHGGSFAIVSPVVADLFGLKSHASNLGLLFFLGMSGGAIGPILAGRLYDTTHTYSVAFVILLGVAVLGLVLALTLHPVRTKAT
jgi:MFS family permease